MHLYRLGELNLSLLNRASINESLLYIASQSISSLSNRLIDELERELATLQIQHQHLARELQESQDSPTKDSQPIQQALRLLLDQMDVKAQHVRLAKTVNKQVS